MPTKDQSCGPLGFSLLEFILFLGILVLGIVTILPSIRKTQEGIAIEKTARGLESCSMAIPFILKEGTLTTNRTEISIAMLNQAFTNTNLSSKVRAPNWPPEADLASFSPQKTGSPTMNVHLKSGVKTVTTDDITSLR